MISYHEDGSVTVASEPDQAVTDLIPAGLTEKERDKRINAFFAANPEPAPAADPRASALEKLALVAGLTPEEVAALLP